MMEKILSVAAIEHGTVIDHIPAGKGLRIVRLLRLDDHKKIVTLGLNLPSKSMGFKDIIKVEDREFSEDEANQIAIFAPEATINIIRDYKLTKKFAVKMPSVISQLIPCPNERCITNFEKMKTCFKIFYFGEKVELKCHYCEKSFPHDTY